MMDLILRWPDAVNGAFELLGGLAITLSIFKLHADKKVRGVSWAHVSFFTVWGLWNLFFYPHLDQWLSFAGGIFIVSANTFWIVQLIYYTMVERHEFVQPYRSGREWW